MNTPIITWPYPLRRGHTDNPADGACAMDAVNWLVHGEHGDQPQCACPVIRAYIIPGNDAMPYDVRQRLLDYLPRIAGSRSQAHETERMRVVVLGALRIFVPRTLDAAGFHSLAAVLRAIPDDSNYSVMEIWAQAAKAVMVGGRWPEPESPASVAWIMCEAALYAVKLAARADVPNAAAEAWGAMLTDVMSVIVARKVANKATNWDDYFLVLNAVLSAGPQGEPWSADVVDAGTALYVQSGGVACDMPREEASV